VPYIGQGLTEGRRRVYNYSATASQTTFAATYDVGYVDVYQNGILLTTTDYTATNGTTVVLDTGAALNDEITIVAHQIFSVTDTVSASQGGTFSGAITASGGVVGNVTGQVSDISNHDTDALSEGSSNLYYTDARVDTRLASGSVGNIVTTGYIAGPANFVIDPAAVGDNTGTLVVAGNLQVDGTTTTINSTTMTVDDLNLTLASGAANAAAANGAGITIDGASATLIYNSTDDTWDFNKVITANGVKVDDNQDIVLGTDDDLTIRHGGANGSINNTTGNLGYNSAQHIFGDQFGSEYARIDSNGNVGIGTNSPGLTGFNAPALTIGDGTGTAVRHAVEINGAQSNLNQSIGDFNVFNKGTLVSRLLTVRGSADNSGVLTFYTNNAGNLAERMRIDSSGNVGIGTNNPVTNLTVVQSGSVPTSGFSATQWQGVFANTSTASSIARVGIYSGNATAALLNFGDADDADIGGLSYDNSDDSLAFRTNNAEHLRIDNSGNVGIGHTDPDQALDVKGNFTLRDSTGNLAHGMSVFGDDDQYAIFNQEASGDGGLRITTLSDATTATSAFQVNAVATTVSADGNNAVIRLRAAKKNGTTEQALASNEDVFTVGNTGTELIVIKGDGSIGMGTNTPSSMLHLRSGAAQQPHILLENNVSSGADVGITFADSVENYGYRLGIDDSGNKCVITYKSTGIDPIHATDEDKLRIDATGSEFLIRTTPNGTTINETANYSGKFTIGTDGTNTGNGVKIPLVFRVDSSSGDHISSVIEAGREATGWDTYLAFYTNNQTSGTYGVDAVQEKMRITSGGYVGIGTNAPGTPLDVRHDSLPLIRVKANTATGQAALYLDGYSDGVSTHRASRINFRKDTTTEWSIVNDYTQNDSNKLDFEYAGGRKITFDSQGRVGILNDTPTAQLHINANANTTEPFAINDTNPSGATFKHRISFKYNGGEVGSIKSNNASTTYNTTSDRRLKENIELITDGKEKIMAMKPSTFNFINDESKTKTHGFIAQEMQQVMPEAVSDGTTMSMDYGRITPVIVAALQDALKEIEQLKTRINELEAK